MHLPLPPFFGNAAHQQAEARPEAFETPSGVCANITKDRPRVVARKDTEYPEPCERVRDMRRDMLAMTLASWHYGAMAGAVWHYGAMAGAVWHYGAMAGAVLSGGLEGLMCTTQIG